LQGLVQSDSSSSLISRGQGRSYGDAALNEGDGVVLQDRLNRFLEFDAKNGILHCEAGVTLAEIIDLFLPVGFFPAITPGTKNISLGGAIAADVHGKNHHRDGTISAQVIEFRLLTARGEVLLCSRVENVDIFWSTLGGMGLTGIVLDVRIQLRPVESGYLHGSTLRTRNLDETLEEVLGHDLEYDYAVAWIDCITSRRSLGRAVLLRARPAGVADLPARLRESPFARRPALPWNVPFHWPSFALNRISMRLANQMYYTRHRTSESLIDYERYFYPLDAISNWSRIYGRRGVLQYQLVLPIDTCRAGLVEIMAKVTASGLASFLAVLKSTGPGNAGPLSFPIEGASLAMDFPNRGKALVGLLRELDEIVMRHGGRTYLAKDSTLEPETFRSMYPRYSEFLEVKARVDPDQRFSSSLARRLGLVLQ
jgi:FAD/FMN-containing dehydrogenase